MTHAFTAIYEERGKWIVAYVEELPGVNTQGRTMAEARRNLKEAIALIISSERAVMTMTGINWVSLFCLMARQTS